MLPCPPQIPNSLPWGLNSDHHGEKPAANGFGTSLAKVISVNSNTFSLALNPAQVPPPSYTHTNTHVYIHTRDVSKYVTTMNT